MTGYTAHVDTFARDNLPPRELWPEFLLDRPAFRYPERMNCAVELLDKAVDERGWGDRPCLRAAAGIWTYAQLRAEVDRIARVLVEDLGLATGNRVMLRAANNPMMVACWFAVAKAGGIVVATMPLLRARELSVIADKAEIALALCDARLMDEMEKAKAATPCLARICTFDGSKLGDGEGEIERLAAKKSGGFKAVDTAQDDVVLIAFTSGTTGKPKGTMHFHRDVMACTDAFPPHCLRARPDDIFIGSPPLAFTFGLGGLVLFPMRAGASTYLLEAPSPPNLMAAIGEVGATTLFTAPTAFRAILNAQEQAAPSDRAELSSLHSCVSAGETLPKPTFEAWREATGIRIIDGLGSTEMLHIFISCPPEEMVGGKTGKPIRGYEARIVDEEMNPLPVGEIGLLAVRGPTGCRYLADDRQTNYVRKGWNVTGDAYVMDEEGYFIFKARADDMIISSGYNISGPEVEDALLEHDAVAECAVVGAPDENRGQIVKAFVVPKQGTEVSDALVKELQGFVRERIAPYKYPRAVEFVDTLPRTETGKVQRFKLREQA